MGPKPRTSGAGVRHRAKDSTRRWWRVPDDTRYRTTGAQVPGLLRYSRDESHLCRRARHPDRRSGRPDRGRPLVSRAPRGRARRLRCGPPPGRDLRGHGHGPGRPVGSRASSPPRPDGLRRATGGARDRLGTHGRGLRRRRRLGRRPAVVDARRPRASRGVGPRWRVPGVGRRRAPAIDRGSQVADRDSGPGASLDERRGSGRAASSARGGGPAGRARCPAVSRRGRTRSTRSPATSRPP